MSGLEEILEFRDSPKLLRKAFKSAADLRISITKHEKNASLGQDLLIIVTSDINMEGVWNIIPPEFHRSIFHVSELQYKILDNRMVQRCLPVTKISSNNAKLLPKISSNDPLVRRMNFKVGDVLSFGKYSFARVVMGIEIKVEDGLTDANIESLENSPCKSLAKKISSGSRNDLRIGIIAIQSILRKATQSNLSMFHQSGTIEGSILPKPSIKDILEMSGRNCSSTCFSKIYKVCKMISPIDLRDFITGYSFNPTNEPSNVWYTFKDLDPFSFYTRIYMDPRKFCRLGITIEEIAYSIFGPSGKRCNYYVSPNFLGMIDVETIPSKALSEQEPSEDKNGCYIADVLKMVSKPDLFRSGTNFSKSRYYTSKGKLGISKSFVRRICSETDKGLLSTIGSDILLLLLTPEIDSTTIASNDILDVSNLFGVEASRRLIEDLIDDEYASVVSSFMTRSGIVQPIKQQNLRDYDRGFIPVISFERVRDSIKAMIGETDKVRSIYSAIFNSDF